MEAFIKLVRKDQTSCSYKDFNLTNQTLNSEIHMAGIYILASVEIEDQHGNS